MARQASCTDKEVPSITTGATCKSQMITAGNGIDLNMCTIWPSPSTDISTYNSTTKSDTTLSLAYDDPSSHKHTRFPLKTNETGGTTVKSVQLQSSTVQSLKVSGVQSSVVLHMQKPMTDMPHSPMQSPAKIKSSMAAPLADVDHPKQFMIDVVTWNINKGSKKVESTKGFADLRHHLTSQFFINRPSTFACLQEIESTPKGVPNYCCQEGGKPMKEAGVAYPNDTNIKSYPIDGYDKVANQRHWGRVIHIEDDGNTHKFILISYHGVYRGLNECNRLDHIRKFFSEMCDISDSHHMTVVIGGDFNLEVGKWKDAIEKEFAGRVIVACKYELGPRRKSKEIIDTFAVMYPSNVSHYTRCITNSIIAVKFIPEGASNYGVCIPYDTVCYDPGNDSASKCLIGLMDHDPVMISLTLKTY
jgi:hypothetical protein